MIRLANIIERYGQEVREQYDDRLRSDQLSAMDTIKNCRTPKAGESTYYCPECNKIESFPLSCGHRACPVCQNNVSTEWLDKQRAKLLPVDYYMITVTISAILRPISLEYNKLFYSLMFKAAENAIKELTLDKKYLGAEVGMTGVFHPNNRRLDVHPHIHFILPGGGFLPGKKRWKKQKSKYLIPNQRLANLFKKHLICLMLDNNIAIPNGLYKTKWSANVKNVGTGEPALKYLSRYLYRGVISEKNIIEDKNGMVTFSYINSTTQKEEMRKLPGAEFLFYILRLILPKGFRRCRDYGFLHGNAKKTLSLLQIVLKMVVPVLKKKLKPICKCRHCKTTMLLLMVKGVLIRPLALAFSPPGSIK